ncbi:MAG: universal stress protein [Spirochaetales bacterium]|nr:universal stress protein [Spirochaetales bacterium]
MIKEIDIGIDGSQESFEAYEYGLNIAKRIKSNVKAVFVIDQRKTQVPYIYAGGTYEISYERIYIPPDPGISSFYEKVAQDLRQFAENCLERCRGLAKERGVPWQGVVREGFPAAELAEESRSGDVLIVGQMGENAKYKRELVGSTVEDLIRSSPRPVIVCPKSRNPIKKVLFPYDRSRAAENALQLYCNAMKDLAEDFILFLSGEEGEITDCAEDEVQYLKQHGIPVRLVCDSAPPMQAILKKADEEDVDLILVGSHGRNKIKDYLLGSTTVNLVRKSSIPVMIVY